MVAYSENSRMISKLELNDFFFLMSSLIPGMFKSITKNINININLKLDYIVFEEACYMAKLCFYKMYTFIKNPIGEYTLYLWHFPITYFEVLLSGLPFFNI